MLMCNEIGVVSVVGGLPRSRYARMTKSIRIVALWLGLIAAWAAPHAVAQGRTEYPTKPIRFIIPFAPGGSQDTIARLVTQRVSDRVSQQFIIDSRPGAAGLIAAEIVSRSSADGYTLLLATGGAVTIAPSLHKALGYDPARDLTPITHLVNMPMALLVSPTLPVTTLSEFLAYARANPDKITYASPGPGSISNLTMELFKGQTGISGVHVPYKNFASAYVDLAAGQVAVTFISTASAQPHVKSGKVRALAVAADKRSSMMPQLPTVSEAGVKDFTAPVWVGVMTRTGVPAAIIDRLNREFIEVLREDELRQRLAFLGAETVAAPPPEFARLLKEDAERWARVIKAANLGPGR